MRAGPFLSASVTLIVACGLVQGEQSDRIDFVRDIQPLLENKCNACHGVDVQEGQLRLDARASVFKGGVSGALLTPGKGQESLLYQRISGLGDGDRMPLDDEPLTAAEIDRIRRWIDEGASWPENVGADVSIAAHWAYEVPLRPALPETDDPAWIKTPLDAFVLRRLTTEGLLPSPRADESQLLRRVYLDLIGLPPSVAEVDAFLADSAPDKFERVVDRLLASPRYGERWARPWLDAARYADTNGYQADQYRNIWPYRDWVIGAMNDDMPFDQFTREQIAGDLLPEATIQQRIATGFHRLTTCNVEAGVDPEENRVNQIIDRVNTTGTVWLGTTIECAQCHNHKYDPFTQRDYYQLFAYFNNTPLEVEGDGVTYEFTGPTMNLPLDDEQQAQRDRLSQQLQSLQAELDASIAKRLNDLPAWVEQMARADGEQPRWHVLDITSFDSQGGASHTLLEDKSVLVSGAEADTDVYTVLATTSLTGITGFKLEALTDPSLPDNGPGRHARPNFILHEFAVDAAPQGTTEVAMRVDLHGAAADFSQAKWSVAGAIDGDSKTGWGINPQFGETHEATFLTTKPIDFETGAALTFRLDQHYGGCRTIGRLRLSAMTGDPGRESMPSDIANALVAKKRTAKQQAALEDYFTGLDSNVTTLRERVAAVQKELDAIKPLTTLVMIEKEPRMTAVFKRGSFLDPGAPVSMATPESLPDASAAASSDRRELASWLVDRQNPLTARVTVNRWWAEFFGHGVVATLEDFGTQGELPTHPELLDWLAVEFMDSGWSMKHLHRQIVLSATYQQDSNVTPRLLRRDPYNLLHARGPRFRLPAETIRDNALAISGLLACDLGGAPVYPPQPDGIWRHVGRNAPKYNTSQGNDRFRRGLYVFWRRSAPYPSFINFDAPDRASCVVQRPRTNTPLQALTLLNDPAYVELAMGLAERIMTAGAPRTVEDRIAYAFRLCVARQPKPEELQHLSEVYQQELARFGETPDAAESLVGKARDRKLNQQELAAWFYVANILLNLDETITKS